MEVSIRKINVADVDALSAIARQTFYDTFTGTCSEEDMQDFLQRYYNTVQLSSELNNPLTFCYFAEVDNIPVAYLHFMEDYKGLPLMKKWKALELKRLYILKEYQGTGIAQKLMDLFLT
ncbi:MAG TPA: GNAT family N-acetyltransferase, partial [Ferruginibacter sp.]|nr:GNAT family N-acetyltransferase [Ferruginibacter sp.]